MTGNLYADLPVGSQPEQFLELLARPGVRIERIVSRGHVTPAGQWYEQAQGEWVIVLSGAARLRFEDENVPRALAPGDWVDIAPGRRHRVEWTDATVPTVWLAVHYGVGAAGAGAGK